jgi:ABC-type transport system involved in cytochrome c biogenesis permease subunit
MAKAMARTNDRNPSSSASLSTQASWILLVVGVVVLTVVAISVPHLVGAAGWLTGEKFLYLALVAYLGGAALYVFSAALRESRLLAGAMALTRGGFLLHTTAIVARWVSSGHAPLSNIYEMVLIFSWGVVALHEVAERKFELPFLGAITVPIAALALVLMQVLPGEIRPLVPALQSTWLQIHVTLAMLSYAGFTISFAVALLYLIKDGVTTRSFLSWSVALVLGVYGIVVVTCVNGSLALTMPAWDSAAREKVMLAPRQALLVPIAALGWPFVIVLALAAATLALNLLGTFSPQGQRWENLARRAFLAALLGQVLSLVLFNWKMHAGPYFVPQYGQSFDVHLAASPFLLAGVVTALFASLAWQVLRWKHDPLVAYLPSCDTLDALIYKTVAISFPLLTLMIIAGAYWANRTWGSYWSWDPKEDWALITWLTYAAYLHMRLTRGWRGRRSAYFAILGFGIVMFTFFGVTYLLPGLHAYA